VANVQPDGGIGAGRPGHAPDLFFRVADLDVAMARVIELGGTAQFLGAGDEGRHAMCTDDQDVVFGLSEPAPGR
jgi:predicted enzyme related to lactoylglutathione lyase